MRLNRFPRFGVPTLAFFLAAGAAQADPVYIGFDVTVNALHGNMQDLFDAPIAAGDVLHGTLSFDPAGATDLQPDPLYGVYAVPGQLALDHGTGLAGAIGAIHVIDNQWGVGYPTDYLATVAEEIVVPGFYGVFMTAEFYGPPDAATGAPLPGTAAEFLNWFGQRGSFRFAANQDGVPVPWDDTTHALFGTIRLSATPPAPVPEPGTLLLVAGAGAAWLRRRGRAR